MAPVFTIPEGHIAKRADTIDEVDRHIDESDSVFDMAPKPYGIEELGYVAVKEQEQVVRVFL